MVVLLASKLTLIFRGLIAAGSFPVLWRTANITQIPKGCSPFQFYLDYKSISTKPIIIHNLQNQFLLFFLG